MKKLELMLSLGLDPAQIDNTELSYTKAGWVATVKIKNSYYGEVLNAFPANSVTVLNEMEKYNMSPSENPYDETYFDDHETWNPDKFVNHKEIGQGAANKPFVIGIDTTLINHSTSYTISPDDSFTLPLTSGLNYDFDVDWGDGTKETITDSTPVTHNYFTQGQYSVSISGIVPEMIFSSSATAEGNKIVDIEAWGNVAWRNVHRMFDVCKNIGDISAKDIPNFGNLSDLFGMFRGCSNFSGGTHFKYWDLSGITSLRNMLGSTPAFTSDISDWDVSNIRNFSGLFYDCINLNQDFSKWNVSNAVTFKHMFQDCTNFTGVGLENWKVGKVRDFSLAFSLCSNFNADLSAWDTSSAVNMQEMFQSASAFTGTGIGAWNVENVKNFKWVLANCVNFETDLSGWNPKSATTLASAFWGDSLFTGTGLENWDVSNVSNMNYIFTNCISFDCDLGAWNTESATTMTSTFWDCRLYDGRGLENWDVSKIGDFQWLFGLSAITQDISGWDMSSAQYLSGMFYQCPVFNVDLSAWNTSNVETGVDMFVSAAAYNQPIEKWDLGKMYAGAEAGFDRAFNGTAMSTVNYDLALDAWANETYHSTPTGMVLGISGTQYTAAQQANRDKLVNDFAWVITDAGSA